MMARRGRYIGSHVVLRLTCEDAPWEGQLVSKHEEDDLLLYTMKFEDGLEIEFSWMDLSWMQIKHLPKKQRYRKNAKVIPIRIEK